MKETGRQVWVVGEALIDLVSSREDVQIPMVGGGPCNTAKALARLGHQTYFIGGISSDEYGRVIEEELEKSGVDLALSYRGQLPTALAIARINESGLASYEFELEETTSFAFDISWLPKQDPYVIHLGSVATLLEPGASQLLSWVGEKSAVVVFDPNVRPSIEKNQEIYRASVERWIDLAKIVKLSQDDLSWLYQDSESDVIASWLDRGVELVVVTRAEQGLSAFNNEGRIDCPAAKVELVDSIGAGDTIGAVIVEGVLNFGLAELKGDNLRQVLKRAAKAAGITCSRAGANPAWKEELDLAL